MKITVDVPEGMELVKVDDTTYSIRKKDEKPRSWEEYTKLPDMYPSKCFYHTLQINAPCDLDLANALKALGKILCLHREWVGDWKPDWTNSTYKYCIAVEGNCPNVYSFCSNYQILSFPDKEMAKDFLHTFRELIDDAKYFLKT